MLDTVGRKSFLNHSWKYGHTPSTQTLIQCIKYLLAHLLLRRSRGSYPSFADPEPRAVMCTHPEPPPISWTFPLPLLTRTFFDCYISSKFCIITFPCPPSVRSSSPASEMTVVTLEIQALLSPSVTVVHCMMAGKCWDFLSVSLGHVHMNPNYQSCLAHPGRIDSPASCQGDTPRQHSLPFQVPS